MDLTTFTLPRPQTLPAPPLAGSRLAVTLRTTVTWTCPTTGQPRPPAALCLAYTPQERLLDTEALGPWLQSLATTAAYDEAFALALHRALSAATGVAVQVELALAPCAGVQPTLVVM